MDFISGLIIGAIVGAIFSVAADRLWRKVESKPRLRIVVAHFQSVGDFHGIQYTIENLGATAVHDYQIWLYHPGRGSFNYFEDGSNLGQLLPGQSRTHKCPLIEKGMPYVSGFFGSCEGNAISLDDIIFDQFEFQIRMKESPVIIFRNKTMGNALAKICVVAEKGGGIGWSWNEQLELNSPKPTSWQRRTNRVLVLLGLRLVLPHAYPEDSE